jgi:hypothetical protein
MFRTSYLRDFAEKDSVQLLTKDPVAIRIFLNEKLSIHKNLVVRVDDELIPLKAQAIRLIAALKNEYHLQ